MINQNGNILRNQPKIFITSIKRAEKVNTQNGHIFWT